jgi:cell division protein FtsN
MKSPFSPLQKLFIYQRREMVVLIALGSVIGLFMFTLGVHLGKEVTPIEPPGDRDPKLVTSIADQIPTNQELIGPSKPTQQAVEESLDKTLHDEVAKMKLRLSPHFQTELPEKAKSHSAGATTLKPKSPANEDAHEKTPDQTSENKESNSEDPKRKVASVEETPKSHNSEPTVKNHSENDPYLIQIGSFPNEQEAERKIEELKHNELQPFMKKVKVKGKGEWFRLYLGSYPTKLAAEKAGNLYIAEHKIKAFIVSKLAD